MFTSGSTGIPKAVPMTHDNYINFVENALEILPFSQGEVFFPIIMILLLTSPYFIYFARR